jgi:hypothetical protein
MAVLLILLLIVAGFLWAGWALMRSVAKLAPRRQWGSAAILLLFILLEAVQWFAGYTLAIPMAPLLTMVFGIIAYILGVFLLCLKSPAAAAIGITVPLFFIVFLVGRGFILLVLFVGMEGFVPDDWGRVSPTLSWQTFRGHAPIGGSAFEGYKIYRNPAWFPLIQKKVTNGSMPCQKGMFSRGRDEHSIQITCANRLGTLQAIEVRVP